MADDAARGRWEHRRMLSSRPAITIEPQRHWTWGPFLSPAARRAVNRRYAAVDG
jgi:hypothetical protein